MVESHSYPSPWSPFLPGQNCAGLLWRYKNSLLFDWLLQQFWLDFGGLPLKARSPTRCDIKMIMTLLDFWTIFIILALRWPTKFHKIIKKPLQIQFKLNKFGFLKNINSPTPWTHFLNYTKIKKLYFRNKRKIKQQIIDFWLNIWSNFQLQTKTKRENQNAK